MENSEFLNVFAPPTTSGNMARSAFRFQQEFEQSFNEIRFNEAPHPSVAADPHR